jgi:hypothetical protein
VLERPRGGPASILALLIQPIMVICILMIYHYFVFSEMGARIVNLEEHWIASVSGDGGGVVDCAGPPTGKSSGAGGVSLASTMVPGNMYINLKAPPNLPSVLAASADVGRKNSSINAKYGGTIDKPHLGGFLVDKIDYAGYSPALFNFMIGQIAVKSVVDVGCGVGYALKYFKDRGAHSICVEGSHEAVMNTKLPPSIVVEHDFTRGPWWPTETFDVAWSVEFLEHVGRQYMENYLPIFKKSALIFVTSSMWGM